MLRIRTLGRCLVILGLYGVAALGGMAGDAPLLALAFEAPPDGKKNDQAGDYREQRDQLRVAQHAEHRSGIDADEFDQKTRQAGPNKIFSDDFSAGTRAQQRARAQPPEVPKNNHAHQEFVNRRGMDALCGRHQAVGKTHAPGERCGDAVVAIARNETSDAADGVAERGGRRHYVEHGGNGNLEAARQPEQGEHAGDEAPGPGKSGATEKFTNGIGRKLTRRLQHVIQLGAHDAGQGDYQHDGIADVRQSPAAQVGAQHKVGDDGRSGNQNSVSAQL